MAGDLKRACWNGAHQNHHLTAAVINPNIEIKFHTAPDSALDSTQLRI